MQAILWLTKSIPCADYTIDILVCDIQPCDTDWKAVVVFPEGHTAEVGYYSAVFAEDVQGPSALVMKDGQYITGVVDCRKPS